MAPCRPPCSGTGVRLLINRTLAFLYFVSPSQVNFLVPSTLTPGPVDIELSVDGRYGEAVRVQLAEFSPALFPLDPETVLATRADGSVITYERPAGPGEVIILYATGLGRDPSPDSGGSDSDGNRMVG